MEVDLSQCLIAYEGEIITCPACGLCLAVFTVDAWEGLYFEDLAILEGMTYVYPDDTLALFCPHCKVDALATTQGELIENASGPRVHLSTGWRDLGGE